MAQTLAFVRGGTTRSLLQPTGGMCIRADTQWTPKVARPAYGRLPPDITEDMPIWIQDTSDDALAAELQELHEMQRWAEMYRICNLEDTPVWLEDQTTGETNKRRALVKQIIGDFSLGWHYEDIPDHHIEMPMQVVRAPYWERTAARTFPANTPAAAASIMYDYTATADIVGDVEARIEALNVNVAIGGPIARLWMGLRSANKHNTVTNFAPIWECEDGVNDTDAADVVDGTASGGDKVTVTPGTATWALRMHIFLTNASANYDDNFGNFLWLLRTKVSAGTWEVQLRHGYAGTAADELIQDRIVEVANTSWDYKEMGVQPIPLRDLQVFPLTTLSAAREANRMIAIYARRTSGAGTLDLDCLCPIPVDEGWLYSDNFSAVEGEFWLFGESPAGKIQALSMNSGQQIETFAAVAANNFRLPVGDGRLICVYARDGTSTLTDRIGFSNVADRRQYFERWKSLRGSE